ncbi:MAG: type VI secretion system protein TssA [Leptolyngbya sp. PLA3]|nr:MAG: type VI secretion system protein TssA [Cyanobacteria bacterium CYA]MCE7969179.1 type VI secretion system protein TssA [Leptolyngbya sp. PL-A3]
MGLDIEALLAEISPEEPCGADLSYDPAYYQFMRDAEGTPEQRLGDSVIEAVEPDWRSVKSQGIDLFARTKDLNVTMVLMLALTVNDAINGLAEGLQLLRRLLERWWDQMHPRLDPDENNDPLERMNLISALNVAPGAMGDTRRFQARVREMPLCKSRQLGAFNYRHVLIARGEIERPAGMENPPEMAIIDAAFAEVEPEQLKSDADAAARAASTIRDIDRWILEKVGSNHAPDLQDFIKLLTGVEKFYQEQLVRRGLSEAPAEASVEGQAGGGGGVEQIRGSVKGPEDVRQLIGKICEYYERHEPSSPIPMLLRRAERLVGKGFIDVVRDLSPDALSQLKMVAGVDTFEPR